MRAAVFARLLVPSLLALAGVWLNVAAGQDEPAPKIEWKFTGLDGLKSALAQAKAGDLLLVGLAGSDG